MTTSTTIELPRIDGETPKAYAARVEYVTMGAGRSVDKVADHFGIKTGSRASHYLEWSRRFGWAESARQYDSDMAYITIQEAAEKYRADLAVHRKKAMDSSNNLKALADRLARIMADALQQPREIRGADGNTYRLHSVDVNSSTLTIISKALTTALDLEAHALGVDQLMPSLTPDDSE